MKPIKRLTKLTNNWLFVLAGLLMAIGLVCMGCSSVANSPSDSQGDEAMSFKLTSPAFEQGAIIPNKYTADGPDVSPQLLWTDPPEGTKSFALICDDPDAPAGTWVHWVIYNIPKDKFRFEENMPKSETLADGSLQGTNDFRKVGYGGPCPPPGKPHRYFFKLYALDIRLALPPRATKQMVLNAMKGHILTEAVLVGLYNR